MKQCLLICCSFFFVMANAQTKEAEFKKTENILKRSKGLVTPDFTVVDLAFSEKSLKIDAVAEGKAFAIAANPDWSTFSYSIEKVKENDKISKVVFSFDEEFYITFCENKKQVDKAKEEEMQLYINADDAKQLEEQLNELQTYTWKSLNEIRTADKALLIRLITSNLNTAVEDDDGKVKSVTDCEITFDYGNEEISVPVKQLTIHSKRLVSKEHLICYGKQGAPIKTRKNSTTQTQTMEHPEIELSYQGPDDDVTPVTYAIKRLASFCKL